MEIVIIGGNAAGGTAAQFARKTDRKAEITIIDSEPYGQYSRCALPYALRGDTTEERIIEFSPEWFERNRINALYGWTVMEVDFHEKVVCAKKDGERKEITYDRLIIATGARPWAPPIKGIDADNVFFLRTMDDLKGMKSALNGKKKALIIGAGLIGLEAGESIKKLGLDVTIVEFLPYPLPAMIDSDMADEVRKILEENGINLMCSHEVTEIRGNPVKSVIVKDRESGEEKKIEADIVIVSTGNRPNTEIFTMLEKGERGHIRVNERSETSMPDVYAAGDCTEYLDFVTGEYVPMGMGTMAVRQGMAAGINAAGGDFSIHRFIGTRTTEIFGVEIAAVGPTSESLKRSGIEVVSARFRGKDLPEYMEHGNISVKVLADKDGRILGAQIIGKDAPWRISMFAEALLKGENISNLAKIETPYAPPIAPTIDTTSIACTMLEMRLRRRR